MIKRDDNSFIGLELGVFEGIIFTAKGISKSLDSCKSSKDEELMFIDKITNESYVMLKDFKDNEIEADRNGSFFSFLVGILAVSMSYESNIFEDLMESLDDNLDEYEKILLKTEEIDEIANKIISEFNKMENFVLDRRKYLEMVMTLDKMTDEYIKRQK